MSLTFDSARRWAERLLVEAGMPAQDAELTGRALVTADVWGIGSHGLMRLPHYLRRMAAGGIAPAAQMRPVADSGVVASFDGATGLGHPQLWRAATLAAQRCAEHGLAAVSVGNSSHCGAMGFFLTPGVQRGYLSLVFSNGPAAMAPWGGHTAVLSTSPLAAGLPAQPRPVIIDMASTAVARGKVAARAGRGEALPEGWAVDRDGAPTTDPQAALAGMLAPLGGAKGFALGLLVESLTGAAVGPARSAEVPDMFDPTQDGHPQRIAHLVLTIDPARLDVDGGWPARRDALAESVGAAGGRLPGSGRIPADAVAGDTPVSISPDVQRELEAWDARLQPQRQPG